jgi:hypothetical protein
MVVWTKMDFAKEAIETGPYDQKLLLTKMDIRFIDEGLRKISW